MAHDCTTTMRINCGAGRGQNQVRRSLYQKVTANMEKSIAGSVRLLKNPDVEVDVEGNINNNDVLIWNTGQQRFTNGTIASIVTGAGLTKRVREFFIKTAGDNTNDGSSASDAIKCLEIGIEAMSKISTTYEMVQFWILGDTVFNTGNFNGVIREGVLGNIRRGISIRGVPSTTNWGVLAVDAPPRSGAGLNHGLVLLPSGAVNAGVLSAISLSTDVGNKLNSWAANTPLLAGTIFLKGSNGIYPVVVDESTTVDPNGAAASTLQRLYLITSDSNPTVGSAYEQWGFTSKISCTDLLGDGLGENTVKPGWTTSGNIQFTEIHVVVTNEATPVHLNGEFQILYSMFTNVTVGGVVGSLALSPSGLGDNTDATAEVVSAATKESTRIIRVYKSVFRDLNILVNNPCHFQDCVFHGCSFKNPKGATFESCLFYTSRPHVLGDSSLQGYLGNSMSLNKCMIVYGTVGSFATCHNQAAIIIKDVLARPMKTNGAQDVPFIMLHDESYAQVEGFYIPANSGLNTSGTGADKAILVSCNNSKITVKDLKIISTGANELSVVLAHDCTDVIIETINAACINGGPLITAYNCRVDINNFDLTLDAGWLLAQVTQGFFELHDCRVTVSPIFELDASASTNAILFNLSNTTLVNSVGTTLNTNKFSLINAKLKHLFNINHNSQVTITTGDPSSASAGEQKDFIGRCTIGSYSTFNVIGTPDGSWANDWSDNINWKMDDGGNGWSLFEISNGSVVNIDTINLDVTEGGVQVNGQRCKLATLTESCSLLIRRSEIDVSGFNTASGLSAAYNSDININTCKVNIRTGTSASLVSVLENSSLTIVNPTPAVATLFTGGNSDRMINVDYNSNVNIHNMSLTVAAACAEGVKLNHGSKLSFTAASSNPAPIIFTGTSGPSDALIEAYNNSVVNIEHVTFACHANGGQILFAAGLCRCYLNGLKFSGGNVPNKSATIEDGTRVYVGATSNDMPHTYAVGTISTPRREITKSALDTQKIYPKQSEMATIWDDLRGCMIIKST